MTNCPECGLVQRECECEYFNLLSRLSNDGGSTSFALQALKPLDPTRVANLEHDRRMATNPWHRRYFSAFDSLR